MRSAACGLRSAGFSTQVYHLSRNRIRSLPRHFAQDMPSLVELYVGHNVIEVFEGEQFGASTALTTISLDSNPWVSMAVGTFKGVGNLRVLGVAGGKQTATYPTNVLEVRAEEPPRTPTPSVAWPPRAAIARPRARLLARPPTSLGGRARRMHRASHTCPLA